MILHELRQTNSTNAKQIILGRADTFDKKMFEYAYNPNKVYYLKYNGINWNSVKPLSDVDIVLLDKILCGELVGNEARDTVHEHCLHNGDLVKLIVNKDLDCGVTATTLNKVFGKDFIFKFKAQKAVEMKIEDIPTPILGQIKYNGIRTIAHVYKNRAVLRTYNGKVFHYPALEKALTCKAMQEYLEGFGSGIVLDGELCIGDSKGTNHTDVGGSVNSSIKTGKPIQNSPFTFNVFDLLPMGDFDKQICSSAYKVRYDQLDVLVGLIDNEIVEMSETHWFEDTADIERRFEYLLDNGYEGMILKSKDHYYKYKKTKDWIKLKAIKDCDIKCVSIQGGEGKYTGQIGALICKGVVEGKEIEVKVGSGLTDAQRNMSETEYLGKIIEVKYNDLIQDSEDGSWSLFLPRFVAVRFDK